ncbi:MAG: hypothetical protein ACHQNE_02570 [Candidatus Kapaibacterium sp.]
MTLKTIGIMALTALIAGCAPQQQLTKDQQAYLNRAMAHPIAFKLAKSDAEDAWGRANLYLAQNSSMKMQTASDLLLDTFNPTAIGQFGYSITRASIKDSVFFNVQCNGFHGENSWLSPPEKDENKNSHILALYIATGEIDASLVTK